MSSREHETTATANRDDSLDFLPSGFSATHEFDEAPAGPAETVPGELLDGTPKKQGFVKRNLPFIIVGGIGSVLLCVLLAKMLAGPPPAPGATQKDARAQETSGPQRLPAMQQPQPSQRPAQAPAASELPTNASAPMASAIGVGGSAMTAPLASPASALVAAGESQVSAPKPAAPAFLTPALAGAERPSIGEPEGLRGTVDAQRGALAALTQRVAQLEARAPLARQATASGLSATRTPTRPASANSSRPKAKERSARNDGARRSAQDRKEAEAATRLAASGYSVHIVRDNLAWLRNDAGQIRAYAIGEAIPGVGNLSAVDEQAHAAYVGKQKIK